MSDSYQGSFSAENGALAATLYGPGDENLKFLARALDIEINSRGTELFLYGSRERVEQAVHVLEELCERIKRNDPPSAMDWQYLLSLAQSGEEGKPRSAGSDIVNVTYKGKKIKPATVGQRLYVQAIRDNGITFGIGPAGTGKTYLAVAAAIAAFQSKTVGRIILTRPAVEAGEKLGFLPGDLKEKVDPYLRPLYDALFDCLGFEGFIKLQEKGVIEIAPLAYMRGRTLDDSFIILDEAQNTSHEQMKMFLTRLGFGSKMVVNGDITQVDLPSGRASGLFNIKQIFSGIEGIGIVYLSEKDVVRHELVQKVIKAYEAFEKKVEHMDFVNGR
ncbi:MAG: PhoH family protein [Bacillota bacterium]